MTDGEYDPDLDDDEQDGEEPDDAERQVVADTERNARAHGVTGRDLAYVVNEALRRHREKAQAEREAQERREQEAAERAALAALQARERQAREAGAEASCQTREDDKAKWEAEKKQAAADAHARIPHGSAFMVISNRMVAAQLADYGREHWCRDSDGIELGGNPTVEMIAKAKVRAAEELKSARNFFIALGYAVSELAESHDFDEPSGFLAFGMLPESLLVTDLYKWDHYTINVILRDLKCSANNFPKNYFTEFGYSYRDENIRHFDFYSEDYDQTAFAWGIYLNRDVVLSDDEPIERLADKWPKIRFTYEDVDRLYRKVGRKVAALTPLLAATRAASGVAAQLETRQLVAGLLPVGELALLVGDGQAGKSTIAHQIAAAVTSGAPDVLGYAIDGQGGAQDDAGIAVVLSAEEAPETFARRVYLFEQNGYPGASVIQFVRPAGGLREAMEGIADVPNVRLLIVDAVRGWLHGNEDSSDDVTELLNQLHAFALRTGACVLMLHHGRRRKLREYLKSPGEAVANMRGSGVLTDRPRVVLGMLRKSDGSTVLGVVKSNLQHVIPIHDVVLRFDPASGLHHRADAPATSAKRKNPQAAPVAPVAAGDDVAVVLAEVAAIAGRGGKVQRTGKYSLFGYATPTLADWPRSRVLVALDAAISAGKLSASPVGITIPVPVPAADHDRERR